MNAKKPDDSKRSFHDWAEESKDKMHEVSEEIREGVDELKETFQEARERLLLQLAETTSEIKPLFRGWSHAASVPFMLVGALVVLVLTEDLNNRAGFAFFAFGAITLLSVSGIYHRSNGWVSQKTHMLLRKLDHTSIMILIASSASGFAFILLEPAQRNTLIATMWTLSLVASAARLLSKNPLPKYVSLVVYITLGCIPTFFGGSFYGGTMEIGFAKGWLVFSLILAGGLFYIVGAIIFYGIRPRVWHKENVWTYHENFHMFTVLALGCHFAAFTILALH